MIISGVMPSALRPERRLVSRQNAPITGSKARPVASMECPQYTNTLVVVPGFAARTARVF
jgi:hypothetical protein